MGQKISHNIVIRCAIILLEVQRNRDLLASGIHTILPLTGMLLLIA